MLCCDQERVSEAEARAEAAEAGAAAAKQAGADSAAETKRLLGLLEKETAARIETIQAALGAKEALLNEAEEEVATLMARLRAGAPPPSLPSNPRPLALRPPSI